LRCAVAHSDGGRSFIAERFRGGRGGFV
jgi:hypothetical protein